MGQITEAAAAAGSEPRDALRSFGERLRDLRDENPHASKADLREAVKGAMQAMIVRSREQRQRADTQRMAAESDMLIDVTRLPDRTRISSGVTAERSCRQERQGSCPARIPALPRGWTTGGGLR